MVTQSLEGSALTCGSSKWWHSHYRLSTTGSTASYVTPFYVLLTTFSSAQQYKYRPSCLLGYGVTICPAFVSGYYTYRELWKRAHALPNDELGSRHDCHLSDSVPNWYYTECSRMGQTSGHYESFCVKTLYQHTSDYHPVRRYAHFNVPKPARCQLLWTTFTPAPPFRKHYSAITRRSGLRSHRTSTSCGGTWRMWYGAPATEELLQPITARLITEGKEYSLQTGNKLSLRKGELCM